MAIVLKRVVFFLCVAVVQYFVCARRLADGVNPGSDRSLLPSTDEAALRPIADEDALASEAFEKLAPAQRQTLCERQARTVLREHAKLERALDAGLHATNAQKAGASAGRRMQSDCVEAFCTMATVRNISEPHHYAEDACTALTTRLLALKTRHLIQDGNNRNIEEVCSRLVSGENTAYAEQPRRPLGRVSFHLGRLDGENVSTNEDAARPRLRDSGESNRSDLYADLEGFGEGNASSRHPRSLDPPGPEVKEERARGSTKPSDVTLQGGRLRSLAVDEVQNDTCIRTTDKVIQLILHEYLPKDDLGGNVAMVCERIAREELAKMLLPGDNLTRSDELALEELCYKLDGRLTMAIEDGQLLARANDNGVVEVHGSPESFCNGFLRAAYPRNELTKVPSDLERLPNKPADFGPPADPLEIALGQVVRDRAFQDICVDTVGKLHADVTGTVQTELLHPPVAGTRPRIRTTLAWADDTERLAGCADRLEKEIRPTSSDPLFETDAWAHRLCLDLALGFVALREARLEQPEGFVPPSQLIAVAASTPAGFCNVYAAQFGQRQGEKTTKTKTTTTTTRAKVKPPEDEDRKVANATAKANATANGTANGTTPAKEDVEVVEDQSERTGKEKSMSRTLSSKPLENPNMASVLPARRSGESRVVSVEAPVRNLLGRAASGGPVPVRDNDEGDAADRRSWEGLVAGVISEDAAFRARGSIDA